MSAWESTRTPSLRKSASCSIIALRNNSESPILSSSATVHSPSVDWSLLKEPHGGRLRQWPLPFTHSRGHYPSSSSLRESALLLRVLLTSFGENPVHALEAVMNSIRNSLGMRETEIAKEPSLLWNPHFYAIFIQVHNTL